MAASKISSTKLNEAIKKFGSLHQAIEALDNEKQVSEKDNIQLKKENIELKLTRDKLLSEVAQLDGQISGKKDEWQSLSSKVQQHARQYQLFEAFVAMVAGSPSATSSLQVLATTINILCTGWQASKKVDELRALFVRTVMGDYLKSFRCDYCKAQFMVNKKPHSQYLDYYECPACHSPSFMKPDDSFLKAMVSEEQLENVRRAEQLQKELDNFSPFKAFFDLKCEVCGQPVTQWTDQTIKGGIIGLGWGHEACWDTIKGSFMIVTRTAEILKRPPRHPQP